MKQLLLLLSLAACVLGHGNVLYMIIDGQKVPVSTDGPIRRVDSNSPVKDVTSPLLTCNSNHGVPKPVPLVQPIRAGTNITYQWSDWKVFTNVSS